MNDEWRVELVKKMKEVESRVKDASGHFLECQLYAENPDAGDYKERLQSDRDAVCSQQLVGKLGEWIAWETISQKYAGVSFPDMTIHPVSKKRYSFDIVVSGFSRGFAVKSQWRSKLDLGWSFQWAGTRACDTDRGLFSGNADKSIVAFVLVDDNTYEGRVVSFNWMMDLIERRCFRKPKKRDLREEKVVIYPRKLVDEKMIRGLDEFEKYSKVLDRWIKTIVEESRNMSWGC